jgi:hypothetical protein
MNVKILIHNTKPNVFGQLIAEFGDLIESSTPEIYHEEFDFDTQFQDIPEFENYHVELYKLVKA